MSFSLDTVVPWGRSFAEYRRMFALTDADLGRSILGCADGPAAFNAGLTARGGQVVSCDPLYAFSRDEIAARIDACFETVIEQTRQNVEAFIWSQEIPDVESLATTRQQSMHVFLEDYHQGRSEGRYVAAELPALPFAENQFDLALCSHFLFLYDSLGEEFHLRSVRELTRVAGEVRVFPLIQLDGAASPLVPRVREDLQRRGLLCQIVPVAYEFQRGAREMLQIARS